MSLGPLAASGSSAAAMLAAWGFSLQRLARRSHADSCFSRWSTISGNSPSAKPLGLRLSNLGCFQVAI